MGHRKCGGHCPAENSNAATTKNCRKCNNEFHLPCYDVIASPIKLFVSDNIVFICDACLNELDEHKSPKRKLANNTLLKQSILTPTANGNVTLTQQQQQQQPNAGNTSKKPTNEQIYALLTTISGKMDVQTNKIDEIGNNLSEVEKVVVETSDKSDGLIKLVQTRTNFTANNMLRNLANEHFRPQQQTTSNQAKPLKTPVSTPKTGVHRLKYSTIVKSNLAVTPRPENPSERKRDKTITLVNNETGLAVTSVKVPTPKCGTRDIEIGRPVVARTFVERKTSRKPNELTMALWASNFHPETTTEELDNYIIEYTEVKDKTKFKCTKLVKKDADLTKLTYVSFKIDVSPETYEILKHKENWPKNKTIREFSKLSPPKPTLNDFIPATKSNTDTTKDIDAHNEYHMEIMSEISNQNASNIGDSSGSNAGGSSDNNRSASQSKN